MPSNAAENVEQLTQTLREWQEIEDATVEQTTAIIQKSRNALVRLVMEIIRQDSAMHRRVQQAILDSLEQEAFTLTPEELAEVWDLVEKHAQMERTTIELAEAARRNCRLFVQRHLLSYLIADEQKHERLLSQLEDFKRGIYPYA